MTRTLALGLCTSILVATAACGEATISSSDGGGAGGQGAAGAGGSGGAGGTGGSAGAGGGAGGSGGAGGKGGSAGSGGKGGSGGSGGGSGGSAAIPMKYECSVTDNYYKYVNASEMCHYLNDIGRGMRQRGELEANIKGACGAKGSPWPIPFEYSAEADAKAQEEAERLAKGGTPVGTEVLGGKRIGPRFWHNVMDGFSSNDITYTAHDPPTEGEKYIPEPQTFTCVFDTYIPDIRISLLYAFNCDGPAATHIGCGAAVGADGNIWRVVRLLP